MPVPRASFGALPALVSSLLLRLTSNRPLLRALPFALLLAVGSDGVDEHETTDLTP